LFVVQAGGGIHDLPEVAAVDAPENSRVLRAPVPGQNVRRRTHPWRTERVPETG